MTELESISALLDTNILYPAGMRDIFIQLAVYDTYQPKWTDTIFEEWMRVDRRHNRKHDPSKVRRTQQQLNSLAFNARIDCYERLIADLALPDPDDRHVLAAAIQGKCDYIVTQNLRDFPDQNLSPFGVKAMSADSFLVMLLESNTSVFLAAARAILQKLKHPPLSLDRYLELRQRDGLQETVARLRQYQSLLE